MMKPDEMCTSPLLRLILLVSKRTNALSNIKAVSFLLNTALLVDKVIPGRGKENTVMAASL